MALVKDPVGRARKAKTKVQAARLFQELDVELGLNDDLPTAWENDAEEAQTILRAKSSENGWGDLADPGATTSYKRVRGQKGGIPSTWSPRLSRGAQKGESGGDSSSDDGAGHERRARGAAPGGATRRRAAPRQRGRGRGGRSRNPHFEQTGIPGAARSTSRMALQTLGLMVGMSLLYLLLTNSQRAARGRSAVELLAGGVTGVVRLLIAPIDPLAGRAPRDNSAQARAARGEKVPGYNAPKSLADQVADAAPSAGAHQTAGNVVALQRRPGFHTAPTRRGAQRQSNVFGPRLPNVSTQVQSP